MSVAVTGRQGNALVGGMVWFALLLTNFVVQRADVLVGAWIVNNFVQNDPEIPCRDEVEKVDLFRSLGFGLASH
jgi:hypothetical protein